MGISQRHSRRGMTQEIAHCGERYASHNEPGREGMARVGHESGSPSVLRPHRPGQSHVLRRPIDAQQNCGTFLFLNIKGGIVFSLHFNTS